MNFNGTEINSTLDYLDHFVNYNLNAPAYIFHIHKKFSLRLL